MNKIKNKMRSYKVVRQRSWKCFKSINDDSKIKMNELNK